jgi:hypothetical protein
LLAPAVVGAEVVGPGLADGGDESGHGTLVSSLALYGQLEEQLATEAPLRPAGRLLSIRVLDDQDQFPDIRLWEEHLYEAIMLAANAGARVSTCRLVTSAGRIARRGRRRSAPSSTALRVITTSSW